MEWVDWIILAVLAVSVLGGMAQGFFRTVCSLAGLILGVVLAGWNYARVGVAVHAHRARMKPLPMPLDFC